MLQKHFYWHSYPLLVYKQCSDTKKYHMKIFKTGNHILSVQRDPQRPQPEFLIGDESDLPYQSESEDYLDHRDFYLVKGNTIHPRRRRNDK